jgi:hypothetical protein
MESNELRDQLLKTAREYVNNRAWPWLEPIEMELANAVPGQRVWSVRTNVLAVGMNIRMLIRESDFVVVDAAFLPR